MQPEPPSLAVPSRGRAGSGVGGAWEASLGRGPQETNKSGALAALLPPRPQGQRARPEPGTAARDLPLTCSPGSALRWPGPDPLSARARDVNNPRPLHPLAPAARGGHTCHGASSGGAGVGRQSYCREVSGTVYPDPTFLLASPQAMGDKACAPIGPRGEAVAQAALTRK